MAKNEIRRLLYLSSIGVIGDAQARYLAAMEKYPYDWWESNDPIIITEFQLNEPLLLVPIIRLQNCLESIMGYEAVLRYTKNQPIGFKNLPLKKAAFEAIAEKKKVLFSVMA